MACSIGPVLRILDVYLGSEFFPSRIRIFSIPGLVSASKSLCILTKKMVSKLPQKYDQGCSSRIRILTFLPIPDPGSRGQKGTGSRIPHPDPQHCIGQQCLGHKGTPDYNCVCAYIFLYLACQKLWWCRLVEQKYSKRAPCSYPLSPVSSTNSQREERLRESWECGHSGYDNLGGRG